MLTLDPRSISTLVYRNLKALKDATPDSKGRDEQKSQAVELYTYAATWGLLRLKAEETALSQVHKQAIVDCFFRTLGSLAFSEDSPNPLEGSQGLETLVSMTASDYLGLTGLALQLAREFSFWAEALYPKSTPQTTADNSAAPAEAEL